MNMVMIMNYIKILERTNVSDICSSFVRGGFVVYEHSAVQLKALFSHLLMYILYSYKFPYKIITNFYMKNTDSVRVVPQKWDNYCICFMNLIKVVVI